LTEQNELNTAENILRLLLFVKTMARIQQYTQWVKHTFLMLLALFALASCSVKEPVFRAIGADYQRPLNKTKTLLKVEHNCNFSQDDYHHKTTLQLPDNNLSGTSNKFEINVENALVELVTELPQKTTSDKNTRLYILYKRLKFDMV